MAYFLVISDLVLFFFFFVNTVVFRLLLKVEIEKISIFTIEASDFAVKVLNFPESNEEYKSLSRLKIELT